jgi:transcriptional regulator with XRE-family HTH domain
MVTDFGKRLAQRRQEMGMTQSELARALGVTSQYISITEQGKRSPSLTFLAGLARLLGVTTDYLIIGEKQAVPDIIPLIKADSSLPLKIRNALVDTIEVVRELHNNQSKA